MSEPDATLDQLEQARAAYVAAARSAALKLFRDTRRPITVDDIRRICPPPDEIDPRVMGCVLRPPDWMKVNMVSSTRRECHYRPIGSFVWIG